MAGTYPTAQYLVSQNDTASWPAPANLVKIVVGKATASGVVTVYNGTGTGGTVVGVIDGNAVNTHHFYGARFPAGLFVKLTGAAGNVTVVGY